MPEATDPTRPARLHQWAARRHDLPVSAISMRLAAGDASFRRYFRLQLPDGTTRMLMDAPPDREDSHPFVAIAAQWRAAGLPVPALHGTNLEEGFIELDDLGDTPLQACFQGDDGPTTLAWHVRAIELIHALQNRAPVEGLPAYDAALLGRELDLFPDWCLGEWLGMAPPPAWPALRDDLIAEALRQPVVAVHRDYDAMNLMVQDETLYLIDFQDAVAGPLTYDLISLLRGRYCRFGPTRFAGWVAAFRERAIADGRLDRGVDAATFHRQTQAMSAQRALKVLGIFCRLTLRDARGGYLERLPHFLGHLEDSLGDLPGHEGLHTWLEDTFRPALKARLEAGA